MRKMRKGFLIAAILIPVLVAEAILFYPMFTLVAVNKETGKILTDDSQCFPYVVSWMTSNQLGGHWIPNVEGQIVFCKPDPDGLPYGTLPLAFMPEASYHGRD